MKKILVVMLLSVLVLTGCSSSGEKKEKEAPKIEFAIGETAEVEGLKITVNGIRTLEGEEYIKPEEGAEWIAVDFTFENTGSKSKYIGGILELSMKDNEGREKDSNIWGKLDGSVDGDVLPGEKLSGEKSFVINGDESNLFVYYKPTFSTKDPIKFIIK